MAAPISINFYDDSNEVTATYEISVVKWNIFKKASILSKGLKDKESEEMIDPISDFICEVFANRFTRQDLENSADIGDVMSVFYAIVSRAKGSMGNA